MASANNFDNHLPPVVDTDLYQTIGSLSAKIDNLIKEVDSLKKEQATLSQFAGRWKAGAFVLLGIGSFVTYLIDLFISIYKG